eukprot:1159501-Pelagomonas_calceolata.AAC.9
MKGRGRSDGVLLRSSFSSITMHPLWTLVIAALLLCSCELQLCTLIPEPPLFCADGNGQRLVLMSTNQSMMDVLTLCATVTFIELDEAGKKVAEVQHRWVIKRRRRRCRCHLELCQTSFGLSQVSFGAVPDVIWAMPGVIWAVPGVI